MGATVLSLGAVRLVWYCLSGLSVLPNILQTDGQVWLVYTLCISNWVGLYGSTLCWDKWSGTCVKVVNYLTVECVRCIETKPKLFIK